MAVCPLKEEFSVSCPYLPQCDTPCPDFLTTGACSPPDEPLCRRCEDRPGRVLIWWDEGLGDDGLHGWSEALVCRSCYDPDADELVDD